MKKKKIILLSILMILLTSIVGTFAWLSWSTNESALKLTVGDIQNVRITLSPYRINSSLVPSMSYEETDEYKPIVTNVEVTNNKNVDSKIYLYYRINEIADELIDDSFKYTILRSSDGNNYSEYKTGNFLEATNGMEFIILEDNIAASSTYLYKVYLWIDGSEGDQSHMQGKVFDGELRASISTTDNIVVDEIDGLIPVTIANDGTVTTVSPDSSKWYDYDNKKWANGVLVTESSRSNYKGKYDVVINSEDILAYYVYIPRYKYKIWTTSAGSSPQEIEIVFENKYTSKSSGNSVGEYLTHPAFTFGDKELNGIWVGKFETTQGTEANVGTDNPTILPNTSSLVMQNANTQFKTSLKFAGGTLSDAGDVTFAGSSIYGLSSTIDSHMMKNSEWGAVAYLSHSVYGVNGEVGLNNYYNSTNQTYITGCGTNNITNVAGTGEKCEVLYGSTSSYLQSTTGNISGTFDMAGGADERVMTSMKNIVASSEFSVFPPLKYYDFYDFVSFNFCDSNTCLGHSILETLNWYYDYGKKDLDNSGTPWVRRGGHANYYTDSGIFYISTEWGGADHQIGFRSVLVDTSVDKVIKGQPITYEYTGNYQIFTAQEDGYYKIETWGAQGGNDNEAYYGGYGGYSSGVVKLLSGEQLYIYVGNQGSVSNGTMVQGGYNGGGSALAVNNTYWMSSGGGATDIRYFESEPTSDDLKWNSELGLNSRIMVVGGGGGSGAGGGGSSYGGGGGGLIGIVPSNACGDCGDRTGGSQNAGGIGRSGAGGFGYGSSFVSGTTGCGGGSGYYGGAGDTHEWGASGGSSFISGYSGVNAITSSSDRTHTNNTLHYSDKYFIDGEMQSGVNTGNGKAKITYVGNSYERKNTKLNNVRYIKDCVNGSSLNTGNHWKEIQAIKNGKNMASGKSVTVSSEINTGALSVVVDGIIDDWNYLGIDTVGNQCITVDLGDTYNLDEIAVWHYYHDGRTYNDNVTYVSSDNSNWWSAINKQEAETSQGKRISAWDEIENPKVNSAEFVWISQVMTMNVSATKGSATITDYAFLKTTESSCPETGYTSNGSNSSYSFNEVPITSEYLYCVKVTDGYGNSTIYGEKMAASAVEKIQVGVTLNSNGGIGCSGTTNYILGETYGSLCQPTRNNFTFMGWYNEDDYDMYTVTNIWANGMCQTDTGITFGPYVPLSAGRYKAVISGSGLENLYYEVYQQMNNVKTDIPITNSIKTNNQVTLYFTLDTDLEMVEVITSGETSYTYDSLKIYKEVTSSNIVSIDTDHILTANWDDTSNPVINSFNISYGSDTMNAVINAGDTGSGIVNYGFLKTLDGSCPTTGYTDIGNVNTYNFTGIGGNTEYLYCVKVTDGHGNYAISSARGATTDIYFFGADMTFTSLNSSQYVTLSNIVKDGSFESGGSSSYVGFNGLSVVSSPTHSGYYSARFNICSTCLHIMTQKTSVIPILNHQYYGRSMFRSESGFTTPDARFEWYLNDNSGGWMTFGNNNPTNNNWVMISRILSNNVSTYLGSGNEWLIRSFVWNPTVYSYIDDIVLTDLTAAFGAGNEPTKEIMDLMPYFESTASVYKKKVLIGDTYGNHMPTTSVSISGWEDTSGNAMSNSSIISSSGTTMLIAATLSNNYELGTVPVSIGLSLSGNGTSYYYGNSGSSYTFVGEVASGQGIGYSEPYSAAFKFRTDGYVYTKQTVGTYFTIFPTPGAYKTFYAKIVPASVHNSNGFVYDTTGAASVSVKPGSNAQQNKYSGVSFTINQTLLPNTDYYLYFMGTTSGDPCYINLTNTGTPERGISITLTN